MENKWKFLIILASVLIVSGGVYAYFTYSYDKEVNYQIGGSHKNLTVVWDLTDQAMNVSENLTSMQNLTIRNQGGHSNFQYFFDSNITGVEVGCNATGDINFTLIKDYSQVIEGNGTVFQMNPAFNYFNFVATAVNGRVCSQNITATLNFTEYY